MLYVKRFNPVMQDDSWIDIFSRWEGPADGYWWSEAQQIDLFWKMDCEGYSLAEVDNLSWQAKCRIVSVTGRGAMEVIYPEKQHLSIISMSYTAIVYRSSEVVMHSLVSADTG